MSRTGPTSDEALPTTRVDQSVFERLVAFHVEEVERLLRVAALDVGDLWAVALVPDPDPGSARLWCIWPETHVHHSQLLMSVPGLPAASWEYDSFGLDPEPAQELPSDVAALEKRFLEQFDAMGGTFAGEWMLLEVAKRLNRSGLRTFPVFFIPDPNHAYEHDLAFLLAAALTPVQLAAPDISAALPSPSANFVGEMTGAHDNRTR